MMTYQFMLGVALGWLGVDLIDAHRGRLRPWSLTIGYGILATAWGMVVYANSH